MGLPDLFGSEGPVSPERETLALEDLLDTLRLRGFSPTVTFTAQGNWELTFGNFVVRSFDLKELPWDTLGFLAWSAEQSQKGAS